MKKELINDFINNLDIKLFIDLYASHTDTWIMRQYDLKAWDLQRILDQLCIQKHTRQECIKLAWADSSNKSERIAKNKATKLENFGNANYVNSEKAKQTKFEKYGDAGYHNVEKMKQTKLDRYGSTSYVNTEKAAQTNMDKYGVKSPLQLTHIHTKGIEAAATTTARQKAMDTRFERYGTAFCKAKYKVADIEFDSLPELAIWLYHKENRIEIKRCPKSFKYVVDDRTHIYYPDFEIDCHIVEIKGPQFFEDKGNTGSVLIDPTRKTPQANKIAAAKYQCMLDNGVEIWSDSQYAKYISWFKQNYNIDDFMIKEAK